MITLNALLIQELSLTQPDSHERFLRFEEELDGLDEAIAIGTRKYSNVPVSSEVITEVFEQVLRQTRSRWMRPLLALADSVRIGRIFDRCLP